MRRLARLATLMIAVSAIPAAAQPASDTWQVVVAPYLLGAGLSGTIGARGLEAEVDLSASDVLSHLEFGAMGILVARRGAWGFGADAMYVGLGATAERPPADVDFDQTGLAFYGLRRLGPAAEVTFGLRVNGLDGRINFKGNLGVVAQQSKWWVDPLVGVLLRSPDDRRAQVRLYGEVGGFGVGSDIAWQIFPSVGVRLTERLGLDLGYRWQKLDYESGDGVERFVFDTLTQGPIAGLTIRF